MTSRLVGSRSADYRLRQERCQSLLRLLPLNALIGRICSHNRERDRASLIQITFEVYQQIGSSSVLSGAHYYIKHPAKPLLR
jgi:hypothetical protein